MQETDFDPQRCGTRIPILRVTVALLLLKSDSGYRTTLPADKSTLAERSRQGSVWRAASIPALSMGMTRRASSATCFAFLLLAASCREKLPLSTRPTRSLSQASPMWRSQFLWVDSNWIPRAMLQFRCHLTRGWPC